jgi:hypothetical protein
MPKSVGMNPDPQIADALVGPDSSGRTSHGQEAAHPYVLIPAQAGIQCSFPHRRKIRLDPGLRRDDER